MYIRARRIALLGMHTITIMKYIICNLLVNKNITSDMAHHNYRKCATYNVANRYAFLLN